MSLSANLNDINELVQQMARITKSFQGIYDINMIFVSCIARRTMLSKRYITDRCLIDAAERMAEVLYSAEGM